MFGHCYIERLKCQRRQLRNDAGRALPAWKLTGLLSSDDLVAMRKEVEGDSK
jgi:hypothetical protein